MITFKQFLLETFDIEAVKNKYSHKENLHRIDAFDKSGAVGYIVWDEDDGEIENVFVGRPYRRLGVGTLLWDLAVDWAEKNNAVPPEHSSKRSLEGDLWAKSIGGHIPNITDDVDGWTSR